MTLDRTTYEAWLLDRMDGNLTLAQQRELDAFLAANPDLRADITGLPMIDAGASYPIDWKNELKKGLPPVGAPDAARLNEFLVARLEGDLDNAQELALDKFLYEHPGSEQVAKRIAASKVDAYRIPFTDKASIERHFPPFGMPDKFRLTDFLIAAQEGDLNQQQLGALHQLLQADPAARKEQLLIAAARIPAERIIFQGKPRLKKREVRVIALWQRYAAAASIALLLGFAWWMLGVERYNGPVVAGTEQVKPSTPTKGVTEEHVPQGSGPVTPREQEGPQYPEPESLPEGMRTGPVPPVPTDAPVQHRPSASPILPIEPPAPEPQLVEVPVQPDQAESAPQLAQQPVQDQRTPDAVPHALAAEQPTMADAARAIGGTPIGTVLANTVRQGVLTTDERAKGLDRDDALAAANKAIGAVTGGVGRVEVAPKGARSGWKLRLGQNLAISASTGR